MQRNAMLLSDVIVVSRGRVWSCTETSIFGDIRSSLALNGLEAYLVHPPSLALDQVHQLASCHYRDKLGRPGGLIAAFLCYMGQEGYVGMASSIVFVQGGYYMGQEGYVGMASSCYSSFLGGSQEGYVGIYYVPAGGPIAASWAVLRYMGQEGYVGVAKRLMEITNIMKHGINDIEVTCGCGWLP